MGGVLLVTLIKIVQLLKNCQAVESSRKLPDAMKTLETLKLIPETPMSVLSFFFYFQELLKVEFSKQLKSS